MRLQAEVRGAQQAVASTAAARREIDRVVRRMLADAAERKVVPLARSMAPSIVADSIVARVSTRSVYVTTSARGMNRRRFGLLEYGGTVTGVIRSRSGRPIPIRTARGVIFRQVVRGPRHYQPKAFMRRALAYWQRALAPSLGRQVEGELRRRIEGIGARSVIR